MSEQLPFTVRDEPSGDMGDQASRLQMAQEQAAIQAALAGEVDGTDAHEDRSAVIDVLEGPEVLDGAAVDGSDDPVYGGGMPVTDPAEAAAGASDDAALDPDLAMTGFAQDGAAVAIEEGGSLTDEPSEAGVDPVVGDLDSVGDDLPPVEDLPAVDQQASAEDVDALIDVLDPGHDPDDPQDPDGYGVPPAADGGTAAIDGAELRDPVEGRTDEGPIGG
jgi:hypothetical protein